MIRVFAVEPAAVQLHWRTLPPGAHVVGVGEQVVTVTSGGGPGAVMVEGLRPGQSYAVTLDGKVVASATTLTPPPGPVLTRVATVTDIHIGETHFGLLPRRQLTDDPATAHPVQCLRVALAEIKAWQPDLLVVKGDVTHRSRRSQYELTARIFLDAGLDMPVVMLAGNHDGGDHGSRDPATELAAAALHLEPAVAVRDLPGVRLVAADTVWHRHNSGRVSHVADGVETALREAPGPAILAIHHHLQHWPWVVDKPSGIFPWVAHPFLDRVAAANPATLVTSGHAHRFRRRQHGPLAVTVTGSTKDYPGTWVGYEIHETGVVQIARRIMAPDALAWTEASAGTVGGMWGRWSPGRLADRSFSYLWPAQ